MIVKLLGFLVFFGMFVEGCFGMVWLCGCIEFSLFWEGIVWGSYGFGSRFWVIGVFFDGIGEDVNRVIVRGVGYFFYVDRGCCD